ncbi:MAG: hypothetical protein AB7R00_27290 [Kofleriaceae bacterium]
MFRAYASVAMLCGCGFSVATVPEDGDVAMPIDDAMPDGAAMLDGSDPAPDPLSDCPARYTLSIYDGIRTSRYYVDVAAMPAVGSFWTNHADCSDDSTGKTHLPVIDSPAEAVALDDALTAMGLGTTRFYAGAVQSPQAIGANAGWITLTGEPVTPALWGTLSGELQPNDSDGIESLPDATSPSNHEEQIAVLNFTVGYLYDAAGTSAYRVMCECDGKPIAAAADLYIRFDPNHPARF